MSVTRKCLFALVPVALLWLSVEGLLRIASVSTSLETEDPFIGFEASLPLFVEGRAANGRIYLDTAANKHKYFNAQQFAREKPAHSRRVFCLGGSTTYGRPYDDGTSFCGFLRASLRAIAPNVSWEVVNAGGISYASYRVAVVANELARYEPDLLVVYTGHNEFLEERSYHAMRELPAWRVGFERRLRSLRSYAVFEALLRLGTRSTRHDDRDTLAAEVETRLDSSIGLDAYTRDDALAAKVIEHFRFNLERIIERGRSSGAEVLLVVPAGNLADASPFKSETSKNISPLQEQQFYSAFDAGIAAFQSGALGQAHELLERAVSLDPRYAHAHYAYGRVLVAEHHYAEARQHFEAARDEDVCPLRARSEIVAVAREVSSRLEVPTVDFPELIARSLGPDKPPRGAGWFLDHVHPTIEGNRLLARAILSELHRTGWLAHDPKQFASALEAADARVRQEIDEESLGISMRNLAKVLSWAGKTEEAARSAERALDLLGDDAESFFILSLDAGDSRRAIALLREALRLDPDWVKPRLNLGVELARSGRHEAALVAYAQVISRAPKHRSVHYNRGRVLVRMGRLDEAAAAFRTSLAIDPADEAAREELADIASARPLLALGADRK
jgi:tetratricopeptide (TPR) repeat protein